MPTAFDQHFNEQGFQESMNALAQKGCEGDLTASEEAELESYRHVGHLLALIHSKARASLKHSLG